MKFNIAFTAALFALAAGPAHAGFVAAAFSWIGGILAGGGVAAALARIALGIGFNLLSSAIAKRAAAKGAKVDVKFSIELGDDTPLAFTVGRFATAGKRKYIGSWGPNTRYITEVIEVSCLPQPGQPGLWVNDVRAEIDWVNADTYSERVITGYTTRVGEKGRTERVPIYGSSTVTIGYPVSNYAGGDRIWVKWVAGAAAADPFLTGVFGDDPDYPWTSEMIGTGKSYLIVTTRYDKNEITSYPQYLIEPPPLPVYDPRKDSTAGGVGAHRWGNRATYQASLNPAVISYNLARGIYLGDEWIFGGKNLSAWRLPLAEWIAAMNACDEDVDLAEGGSEPAYRCGAEITVDMEPLGVMEEIGRAANIRFAEVGGRLKALVGLPGAAAFSITDGDIIITEGQSLTPFLPVSQTFNALAASYPEPAEKWASKPAPEYVDAEATAEDNGDYLPVGVTYGAAPFPQQVQRLMRSQMRDYRRMAVAQFHLPPDAFGLEPLVDMITWTSARNGYANKAFVVEAVAKLPGMNVSVTLREVEPGDYDWDSGWEQPVVIAPPVNVIPVVLAVEDFAAVGVAVKGEDGRDRLAGITVSCDSDLSGVAAVRIQVRKIGATDPLLDVSRPYAAPHVWTVTGVAPETTYFVRLIFVPEHGQLVDWSDEIEVLTPPILIDLPDLAPDVSGAMTATLAAAGEAAGYAASANTSKNLAETAKAEAQTAKAAAETAATAALGSKTAAETAAGQSLTAKTASEAAKTASETARTQAQTAATNAGNSATAAAGSAATATTKATEAGNSATAAAASVVAAQSAFTNTVMVGGNQGFEDGFIGWQAGYTVGAPALAAAHGAIGSFEGRPHVFVSSTPHRDVMVGKIFPILPGRKYRIRTSFKINGTGNCRMYVGFTARDAAGAAVGSNAGLVYNVVAGTVYAAPQPWNEAASAPFDLTYLQAQKGATAVAIQLIAFLNYDINTAVSVGLDGIWLEDVTESQASATSAAAAATSATDSATSAAASNTAKAAAETARGQAQTSATNAATSETNAAGSANTATTQAGVATTAKNNAESAASAAAGSAATATTKATEAGTSATAAGASATTATTKAGEASTSATNAATSASTATTKANEASASATVAATQAGNAGASATAASGSANTAATKATEASNSASAAALSATTAATKAAEAATSATQASTAKTDAQGAAAAAAASATTSAKAALGSEAGASGNLAAGGKLSDATLWERHSTGYPSITAAFKADIDGNGTPGFAKDYAGNCWNYGTTPVTITAGRTYRFSVEVRLSAPAGTCYFTWRQPGSAANYGHVVFNPGATDNTWRTVTAEVTAASLLSSWGGVQRQVGFALDHTTPTGTSGIQIRNFRFEDITESKAAATSAAAAVTSADLATAQATLAGNRAAEALTYRNTAARLMSGGVSKNPVFAAWTGTWPDNVAVSIGGGTNTATKNTANARYNNCVELDAKGVAFDGPWVVLAKTAQSLDCRVSPTAVLIRAEVEYVSGDLANSGAMIQALWSDTTDRSKLLHLKDAINATPGVVQTVEFYAERPVAAVPGSATNFSVIFYAASNNGGTRAALKLRLHRLDFEDVLVNTSTSIVQRSVAKLNDISSSVIAMRAVAGSSIAELELVSLTDPVGNPASLMRFNADQLLFEGTVTVEYMNAAFLNGERIRAEYLDIDKLLTILPGGALSYGKTSVASEADGIYFGQDGTRFGLAASRTVGSKVQSIVMSQTAGLHVRNARHSVTAAAPPTVVEVTASHGKIALPAGIKKITLEMIGGGVAGRGIVTQAGSPYWVTYDGGAGQPTLVKLYDGATLKHTFTAPGAVPDYPSAKATTSRGDSRGSASFYAPGGDYVLATPSAGNPGSRGSGGGGARDKFDVTSSTYFGYGGAAAEVVTSETIDLLSYTDPQIEIVIGAGGVPSATPPANKRGGAGGAGFVRYSWSAGVDTPADVVPLIPTATGTFTKAANTAGSFPDLGAGMWFITARPGNSDIRLGLINLGDGSTILSTSADYLSFVSSKTPTYPGTDSGIRTIAYVFYAMGSWGS